MSLTIQGGCPHCGSEDDYFSGPEYRCTGCGKGLHEPWAVDLRPIARAGRGLEALANGIGALALGLFAVMVGIMAWRALAG